MNIQQITQNLKPGWIGKKNQSPNRGINFKPEVLSTNTWALQSLENGANRGDVFLSDFQTDGHGRLDRKWESAKGKNILLSLVDKKPSPESNAPQITLIAGLGFLEGIQSLFPKYSLTLKWPNDILLQGKKIGGILIENHPTKPYLVIGVGLNVNMKTSEFSPAVQKIATTLSEGSGQQIERESLIAACLNHYQKWRDLFDQKGSQPIIEAWKTHSTTLNRKVKINDGRETYEGVAVDLDVSGYLIVESKGQRQTVIAGDVLLL